MRKNTSLMTIYYQRILREPLWTEVVAMKSPNVLGRETRGDGSGPCHGAPALIYLCTNIETICLDNLISTEHGSLPECRALSALTNWSTEKPAFLCLVDELRCRWFFLCRLIHPGLSAAPRVWLDHTGLIRHHIDRLRCSTCFDNKWHHSR